jgi:hypothetical protein
MMSPDEKHYLREMPKSVPDGKILVHNKSRPTAHGFRTWLQPPSDNPSLVVCKCKWAPHLERHYRDKSRWSIDN